MSPREFRLTAFEDKSASAESPANPPERFQTSIHQTEPQSSRWLALEGLRGLAILLVFVVHYTSFLLPHMARHARSLEIATAAAQASQSGVDLFFVLSGLLIYRVCIQENFEVREYAKRRLVRIYPTFLVVFALYICAMLVYPLTSKFPGPAGDNAVYVIANLLLLPGLLPILPIITVAWSLSYELAYYIAMPLLRLTLRLNRWSSLQRSLMAVTAATSMIVAGTLGFGPNLHMIMFPAGIVVYELGSRFGASAACAAGSRWMDVLSLSLVSFTLFAFGLEEAQIWHIANLGALYQRVIEYLALAIAFSLLVYRCLFKQSAAYSIFSWYPLRGLGKISYSFYLLHGLILQGCFRTLNAVRPNYQLGLIGYLLLLLSLLLVAVVLTWPLFVFVESPFSLVELSTIEHAAQVRKWKRHSAAKSTEKTVDSGECRYSKGASVGPGARLQTLE